ncbi:MAG: ABC transporter ATP-binding protein [Phycisphaerae bacterium]
MTSALAVSGLTRRFGDRTALDDVSIETDAGDLVAFLGPNGSGKTTLFRILATLLEPDSGSATVMGHDISIDRARVRRNLGIVFQKPSIDPFLTVMENMTCQGRLYGLSGHDLNERINRQLARFRLTDRAQDRSGVLSGGLQRRLELAKGLLHDPRVLLLDEPSTGLDPAARMELMDELSALREDGVACLLTTHLMEEAQRCDRVAVMDHGRLIAFDSPVVLKSQVGGDVIVVEPVGAKRHHATQLAERLSQSSGLEARAADGVVRIECEDAHQRVPMLYESLREDVESIRVGAPTLSDVFFHLTGRPLLDAEPEEDTPKRRGGRGANRRR